MTLETINNPVTLSIAGTAAAALIPVLEQTALSFPVSRILNLGAYSVIYYATTRPGRIDGVQQAKFEGKMSKESKELMETIKKRDLSLLQPSGWAFIIWAPIFLGELIMTLSSFLLDSSSKVVKTINKVSPAFIASQLFQALWTASFRPKFSKGRQVYLSGIFLSGIALSLNRAHMLFAQESLTWKESIWMLPLSLHFGWTTAAALVNWNGSFAQRGWSQGQLAVAGQSSVILAGVIGVYVTLVRQAPVFGGVIAWALTACATGLAPRSQRESDKVSLKIQRLLCAVSALASIGASTFVAAKGR